ncbi:S24 family peptidase [Dysgonomonas sp. 520]|uniref:S24 family peptidase n=1 Tax=Dysgonomonas sp. 520 TaxID=2302931 RepID=UPI0013D6F1BA|nr:S24 family peptidase [Dysgonomonas sp. 520]NDW11256.1 LexA family transcriptional regulator [Dysgonomonas sp. 520]
MNNVLTQIARLVETEGITITALEKQIGASKGVLSRALNNGSDIQTKWVQAIVENYPLYNATWLLTGEGNMLKNRETIDIEMKSDDNGISIHRLRNDYFNIEKQSIPLYEIEASAGLSTLFSSQIQQIPLDYISIPNAPKCDGAIFVRGDSMYPILKAGDIVCYKHIERIEDVYYGEMYLLDIDVSGDQYLTFKYVQKSDLGDKYIRLVSHNTHHDPKDILKKDIRAIALVKLSIRYNTLS